ncbi:hypothetical protein HJG60_010871 [Phyllostomus discolor]|uniref:Uncharacterized protein n=1 Tax=Phyllostomus discolor TaxID=89673 RepID=A0A834AEQ1_9CHIR|nr:hypothetical protein HJG60_010871 [Phyllostomus discolor]
MLIVSQPRQEERSVCVCARVHARVPSCEPWRLSRLKGIGLAHRGLTGKFHFEKVGKEPVQMGPVLESNKAIFAVANGADSAKQGQPGGEEKLGWRNCKEPHKQVVTSTMRRPKCEKRGMAMPVGGWATRLSVTPTQKHFLKKPALGALNCKTCHTQPLHPPTSSLYSHPLEIPPSTVCREKK